MPARGRTRHELVEPRRRCPCGGPVLIGWLPCVCPTSRMRGHRTAACTSCGREQRWPVCLSKDHTVRQQGIGPA